MSNHFIHPADEPTARDVVVGDVDGIHGLSEAAAPLKFPDYEIDPVDTDAYAPIEAADIQLTENTYSPGGYHDEHAHDDLTQVYYFLAGTTEVTVGDETDIVGPGGVAYIPAETPHSTRVVGDEAVRLLIISIPSTSE